MTYPKSQSPLPNPTIRGATVEDASLLAQLGAQTFYAAYSASLPAVDLRPFITATFSPELQAAELRDPATNFLIAEVGLAPVGYAKVRVGSTVTSAMAELKIDRIYLQQEWIGRGIGGALMDACLALAAARGCRAVRLEVWEHNHGALGFYKRYGFEQVGRVSFQLGSQNQTDLILRRVVATPPGP